MLNATDAHTVPLSLLCTFPTDRSFFIFESAPVATGGLPEWRVVPSTDTQISISVREHGAERLFVAASADMGSASSLFTF